MNWEAALSAALAASVSLNIGLLIRDSQLGKLREWITEQMKIDRHNLRNDLLVNTMQIADLHGDLSQLIALKHPELLGRLPRPLLNPDNR